MPRSTLYSLTAAPRRLTARLAAITSSTMAWAAASTAPRPCGTYAATAVTSRYSSLSALVASFVTPIFLWWFGHLALASLFAVLTLLLFYMHRENIKRLQAGTEGRIGQK